MTGPKGEAYGSRPCCNPLGRASVAISRQTIYSPCSLSEAYKH